MKRTFAKLAGLFVVAAAMAIAQTTPQAAAPAATPAQVRAHRAHKMMRALDLSPQQKQQAKSIFQNTRQQAQPLAQQLKQDRQSLSAAIQSNNTAQIQQLTAAMGTLHGQVAGIRAAGRAQFLTILTPDQKAKAAAFEQQSHGRKG